MERKKKGFSGSSRQTSYEDIIELPHHVSSRHPQMSMLDRAAQFSPFAALTGYGDAVREKARFTEERPELSEEERARLDDTLRQICAAAGEGQNPEIRILYFAPDEKKAGGAYREAAGRIRKIDFGAQQIVLEDGTRIPVACVVELDIVT